MPEQYYIKIFCISSKMFDTNGIQIKYKMSTIIQLLLLIINICLNRL